MLLNLVVRTYNALSSYKDYYINWVDNVNWPVHKEIDES